MTSTEDRTPGRPYPPRLDGELIVQAALELVRREGLAALTMAQLARQLEVAPSALYNHISGKDELLTRVQDEIYSGIDTSGFDRLFELAAGPAADEKIGEALAQGLKSGRGPTARRSAETSSSSHWWARCRRGGRRKRAICTSASPARLPWRGCRPGTSCRPSSRSKTS
ncbi:TetR/AcrR family transcriptional regulator [Corynebacterium atypicum]|uniref:TetR/AcrR family transcriptional regulator n=1 Tax=Corynebacterium atypicum TaxID=191610 RepID=UPI001377B718|nr:TetR/AcrR family transcriptional regulator [Corynebacterium atypicum]